MARKKSTKNRSQKPPRLMTAPVIHPDAAGIDIGATQIYAAVPPDRDAQPVRHFDTFTEDLEALADWLTGCGVRSVAMESTSVYWIPLHQILSDRGLEVFLVNAQHVKHVPGRKSDVSDCQWLQYLHSVGLLRASFRPPHEICAIRTLWRHRDNLIRLACTHVQHMHKALDQMNLQLHHVISDLTGVTGLAIVEAILAGERDPQVLAKLRDPHIRASEETIAKSLVGDYRKEHLFTLRQGLATYRYYQKLIADCDLELRPYLEDLNSRRDPPTPLPPLSKSQKKRYVHEPQFDLRTYQYEIFGVDLTQVPGISTMTVQTLLSEVGPDLSKFRSASAFASWLSVCPNNTITGGRVLSSRTRPSKNRVAAALRMAAQTLHHSKSALGNFYRRMRAKLGGPEAITATAHKLARIIYHLINSKEPYDEKRFLDQDQHYRKRAIASLKVKARALGYQLVSAPELGV